jgi:hypothetical protein
MEARDHPAAYDRKAELIWHDLTRMSGPGDCRESQCLRAGPTSRTFTTIVASSNLK